MRQRLVLFCTLLSGNWIRLCCYELWEYLNFLQVNLDFIKSEPNSHCETYVTSSNSENGMTDIKVEEDPLLITPPIMNNENEVRSIPLYIVNLFRVGIRYLSAHTASLITEF